jgi:oxygen-dependent protoporphyrinogen oxidase
MQRIGIVGGGLAGLCVAFWRANAGDSVVLFEAQTRLGGQIWSEVVDGFVIDHGAEGFVARSEALVELAAELGIRAELVDQMLGDSLRFEGSELIRLAPGEAARALGFQVDPNDLGRGVRAFTLGMGQLTDTLAALLQAEGLRARVEVRLGARARAITLQDGPAVALASGGVEAFDKVVIAIPALPAAALLEPCAGPAARELLHAKTSSSVTVSLAFRRGDVQHALDATGFVVTKPEQAFGLRACTFTSSKLPGRAGPAHALLRCFFRPAPEELRDMDDAAWAERAQVSLGRVLELAGGPQRAWVSRWPQALPIFDDAHVARVRALEAALVGGGVVLAGSAFHGSGIDAAVRSARRAAHGLD